MFHRVLGLAIVALLIFNGLSGAMMVYRPELERMGRPWLSHVAPPAPGSRPLDVSHLVDSIERQTGGMVNEIRFDTPPSNVARVRIGPARPDVALGYDTVWVDRYTGKIVLRFTYGRLRDGAQNIVPFLLNIHTGNAIGPWYIRLMGILALLWMISAVIGVFLTLPMPQRKDRGSGVRKSWVRRWRSAWKVDFKLRGPARLISLHRAAGLWTLPFALLFSWTAIGFNLPEVYSPTMRMLGGSGNHPRMRPPKQPQPLPVPPIKTMEALAIGEKLMAEQTASANLKILYPTYLIYMPAENQWRYAVRTNKDFVNPSSIGGRTSVYFSGINGKLSAFDPPHLPNRTDDVARILFMTHFGQPIGEAVRLVIAMFGIVLAGMGVTGLMIWQRKRGFRRSSRPPGRPVPSKPNKESGAAA